jgi:hypothetical protein
MTYQLKVIKDYPIGFWPLDESSGTTASDISGCGNNATYVGSPASNILPLVSGGLSGTRITNTAYITVPVTKDYYGATSKGGFADKNSSDNDFTLEIWIYPTITTSSLTTIFADSVEGIGIFYEKGNIVFKLQNERLDYSIPHIDKSHHIIACYSKSEMSIYVDGQIKANKALDNYKFTNSSLLLSIGPTSNVLDSFIVDAPAVYRYNLGNIKSSDHYEYSGTTHPIQVSYPDGGTSFEIYDDGVSRQFSFVYPLNKSLDYFLTEDLVYDDNEGCLEIKKTVPGGPKSVVIQDAIAIPSGFDLDASKIEWSGYNGVSIRSSVDQSTWEPCINGGPIPQFKLGSFDSNRTLYLEITMSSSDTSKYIPKLSNIILCFYKDQVVYSPSNGDYIYTAEDVSGLSAKDISMGRTTHPILSRHSHNGLRALAGSGFRINTTESIQTIELFFTPSDLTENCILFSSAQGDYSASKLSWDNAGTISKTNISAIYINGIDKTSSTNVSNLFIAGDLAHVVIVTNSAITGPLGFNYFSQGGPSSLYQYISYYPEAFNQLKSVDHYNMHIGKPFASADDSAITLTENSINFYDIDWQVTKSI